MPIVYKARVFSVEAGKRTFPDGREHDVAIVRHRPSVVLVRQYRAPIDRMTWEFPAGSLDEGESAEAAALRECEEEIARVPARVERLGAWYPVPGYCDEEMIFFRVSNLRAPASDSPHKPDEDENIETRSVTI